MVVTARTRLGEGVHWVRGLNKTRILTGEMKLKACGEDDMVR
jgi:hypothetical protein